MIRQKLWWILACALVGCGGGTGSTAAAIDSACTARAQARCDKRQTCTNGVSIVRVFGDMTTCLLREKLSCVSGQHAPDSGNNPALATQCAAAYASQPCDDFLNGLLPAPCTPTGPRAAGAVCTFNAQCQSGYCAGNRTSICGVCGTPPNAGDPCNADACAPGQECNPTTLLCQPLGAAGDACDPAHRCGNDLGCASANANGVGTCKAGITMLGASCDSMNVCDGTQGLHCETHSGMRTCTTTEYLGDGMSCGVVGSAFVGCANGGGCYTSAGVTTTGQTGVCKTAVADGGACDIVLGPPCLSPARCVVPAGQNQGVCAVADPTVCG